MSGSACAKCGEATPGPAGLLCPPCLDTLDSAPLYPQVPAEPIAAAADPCPPGPAADSSGQRCSGQITGVSDASRV